MTQALPGATTLAGGFLECKGPTRCPAQLQALLREGGLRWGHWRWAIPTEGLGEHGVCVRLALRGKLQGHTWTSSSPTPRRARRWLLPQSDVLLEGAGVVGSPLLRVLLDSYSPGFSSHGSARAMSVLLQGLVLYHQHQHSQQGDPSRATPWMPLRGVSAFSACRNPQGLPGGAQKPVSPGSAWWTWWRFCQPVPSGSAWAGLAPR